MGNPPRLNDERGTSYDGSRTRRATDGSGVEVGGVASPAVAGGVNALQSKTTCSASMGT